VCVCVCEESGTWGYIYSLKLGISASSLNDLL